MLDTESMALIDLLLSELGASRPELKDQLKEVEEEHGRSGKPVFNIIENYGLFKRDELLRGIIKIPFPVKTYFIRNIHAAKLSYHLRLSIKSFIHDG